MVSIKPGHQVGTGSDHTWSAKASRSRRKRCDLRVPPVRPVQSIRRSDQHQRLDQPRACHPRERRIAVLLWLIDNRIPITRTSNVHRELYMVSALALHHGLAPLTKDACRSLNHAFVGNGVLYRPPTYKDAGAIWNINATIILFWWKDRIKYLTPDAYDRSNRLPIYEIAPGIDLPSSAPRPHILPESPTIRNIGNGADDGYGDIAAYESYYSIFDASAVNNRAFDSDDGDLDEEQATRARSSRTSSPDSDQDFYDAPEYQNPEEG